jgi:hypothetical protein
MKTQRNANQKSIHYQHHWAGRQANKQASNINKQQQMTAKFIHISIEIGIRDTMIY